MNTLTKQQARAYLARRVAEHKPPPSIDEIRRQLGFGMAVKPVDRTRGGR